MSVHSAAVCPADNVLRAIRAHSSDAYPYCQTLTATSTSTTYITSTKYSTTSYGTTTLPTSPIYQAAIPTYLTPYPTSRISTACACASQPPVVITATAPVIAEVPDPNAFVNGSIYTSSGKQFKKYYHSFPRIYDVATGPNGPNCCSEGQFPGEEYGGYFVHAANINACIDYAVSVSPYIDRSGNPRNAIGVIFLDHVTATGVNDYGDKNCEVLNEAGDYLITEEMQPDNRFDMSSAILVGYVFEKSPYPGVY